jgi:hypothetical protein
MASVDARPNLPNYIMYCSINSCGDEYFLILLPQIC